jgi:hypothetical protein
VEWWVNKLIREFKKLKEENNENKNGCLYASGDVAGSGSQPGLRR